jgi:hypothetical protein
MNHNIIFTSCVQASPRLTALLERDRELYNDFKEVADEFSQRISNQKGFVLRGKVDVHGPELFNAVRGAVQRIVDHAAANAICAVFRLSPSLILVKCSSKQQRLRITKFRRTFSSVDYYEHDSAAVRQVLRTKLYVDDFCTKQQLGSKSSQWSLFQQLKTTAKRPYFEGDVLYYYPTGSKHAIQHTSAPTIEPKAAAPDQQQRSTALEQQERPAALTVQQSAALQRKEQMQPGMPTSSISPPASPSQTPAKEVTPAFAPAEPLGPASQAAAEASAAPTLTAHVSSKAGGTYQQPKHKRQAAGAQPPKSRPPFRTITNTAPTFGVGPSSAPHGKRSMSYLQPEWGARRKPKARLIPMMMPNGEMGYVVPS